MSNESPVPVALYAALVEAQANVGEVAKDSFNPHHNYKYASSEDVFVAAKQALAKAGLAVLSLGWELVPSGLPEHDTDGVIEGPPAAYDRIFVSYRLVHRSGEYLDFRACGTAVIPGKGRPQDKAEAIALTFNLHYFVRGLLLIARGGEEARDDVNQRDDSGYQPRANGRSEQRQERRERAQAQPERSREPETAESETMVQKLIESNAIARCATFEAQFRSAPTPNALLAFQQPFLLAKKKGEISQAQFERLKEIYVEVRAALIAATRPGLAQAPLAPESGTSLPANDGAVAS